MVFDYAFSMVGKSHIEKGICCQDNHKVKRLENGWYIGAIADGVGSAKNSQIGSKIATETVVEMCDELMPWDYNTISIKSMMRTAYNYAYKKIMREAEKTGNPIESYDTTLSMVIYDGHKIIYGHSGDGAIIGMNSFGNFVEITKPQKGPDGVTVVPLRAGYTQWKIDTYEEDLAAVLLVTDGMRDILCHYLLMAEESKEKIYTPLVSFFADPIGVKVTDNSNCELKKKIEDFLTADEKGDSEAFYSRLTEIYKKRVPNTYNEIINSIKENNYPIGLMQSVQDDKTVVGLINTELLVDNREASFYGEPDWNMLQEAWNRKAYPHLYDQKPDLNSEETKEEIKEVEKNDSENKIENVETESKQDKVAEVSSEACETGKVGEKNVKDQSGIVDKNTQGNNIVSKKSESMSKHGRPKKRGIVGVLGDFLGE